MMDVLIGRRILAAAALAAATTANAGTVSFEVGEGYTAGLALSGQGAPLSWAGQSQIADIGAVNGVGGTQAIRVIDGQPFAFANVRFAPDDVFLGTTNDATGVIRTALDFRVTSPLGPSNTAQTLVLRVGRVDDPGDASDPDGKTISRINVKENGSLSISTGGGEQTVVDASGGTFILTPGQYVSVESFIDFDNQQQFVIVDGVVQGGALGWSSTFLSPPLSYGTFQLRYASNAATTAAYDVDNLTIEAGLPPQGGPTLGFETSEGYNAFTSLSGQGSPLDWSGNSAFAFVGDALNAFSGEQGVAIVQVADPSLAFQNTRFTPNGGFIGGANDGTGEIRTRFWARHDSAIGTDPNIQTLTFRIGRLNSQNAVRLNVKDNGELTYNVDDGITSGEFKVLNAGGSPFVFTPGTWIEIDSVIDYDNQTQTLTVDGVQQNAGLPFGLASSQLFTEYGLFAFRYSNDPLAATAALSIDNLTIQRVPDPCSDTDIAEPFGTIDAFDILEFVDRANAGCP